jgi:ABC-type transport system involved in multi-copper enzyme maturation permease subunit
MNSLTFDPSAIKEADMGRLRLLGLGNLVRKDLAEWLHGKRPWIVLGVTTSVFALAAANARITAWAASLVPAEARVEPVKVLSVLPLDNLMFAIGTQFIVLSVIFASMSLLMSERDSGTLAWTISKPVSRTSVLVSKWLTSTLILWVAAVVIPLSLTTALVTVLYGAPDLAIVVALGATLITVPAFFVAVALTAATFVPSQAAVGAIGVAVFVTPQIVGGVVPALTPFFPGSIFDWAVEASTGGPAALVTPFAWLVGLAVLFVLARQRLNAMDL